MNHGIRSRDHPVIIFSSPSEAKKDDHRMITGFGRNRSSAPWQLRAERHSLGTPVDPSVPPSVWSTQTIRSIGPSLKQAGVETPLCGLRIENGCPKSGQLSTSMISFRESRVYIQVNKSNSVTDCSSQGRCRSSPISSSTRGVIVRKRQHQ